MFKLKQKNARRCEIEVIAFSLFRNDRSSRPPILPQASLQIKKTAKAVHTRRPIDTNAKVNVNVNIAHTSWNDNTRAANDALALLSEGLFHA